MNNQINSAGEQLEKAFQLFNQFSEKLADSYGGLEGHVAQLTKELAQERDERLVQLAEKELLAKRLEGLIDALPAGIVVLDSKGYITQANRIAQDMMSLKFKANQSSNEQWEDIAADTFITEDDELRLKDGRWVNISACPLNDDPGKIILISDVSETHALYKMLNRQQRLSSLGEMIASLAHQIRTPLSSALLYISTSNHPANNENKRLCLVGKAKERLNHLERMMDDMLMFARGDVSDAEYINADVFFTRLKKTLESDYKSQLIIIFMGRNLKGVNIRANSDALLSAIQNIIDNSIKACSDATKYDAYKIKKIEIDVSENNKNQLEINIKDNGCGMSEEIKDRVLEPFFTTRSDGTGLGLAVVNATVSRYGGEMKIDSKQGVGSDFNIKFPCVEVGGMLPSNQASTNKDSIVMNMRNDLNKREMLENSIDDEEVEI